MNSVNNKENRIEESLHCDAMNDAGDEAEVAPWERLQDEPSKAYHAFFLYLREGHWRSLKKVTVALGKGLSYEKQLENWSVKYNWVDRAQAFDIFVERQNIMQYLEEQQAAFGRHIEHARELEVKVFDELKSRELGAMKLSELIRLLDVATKIERDTWTLKSKAGNKISDTYALLRLSPPREVIKRVRQELKEAGVLSEDPDEASRQIFQMLQEL